MSRELLHIIIIVNKLLYVETVTYFKLSYQTVCTVLKNVRFYKLLSHYFVNELIQIL